MIEFQLRRIITSLLSCGYDLKEISANGLKEDVRVSGWWVGGREDMEC